jgi:hypothetical protein
MVKGAAGPQAATAKRQRVKKIEIPRIGKSSCR